MNKFKKRYLLPIIAFVIPIVLLLIYVVIGELTSVDGFFFNGENFLMADMSSQYNSMYSYLRDVLHGSGSLLYSFSKGLGGNMMSTIGYYLSSPLNIIFLFASKTNVPLFIFILLLIKIGLCGSFMFLYLKQKFKNSSFTLIVFSTLYALMGYNVSYYFNNMWLDVVYLTPLVLWGLDKIIKKESPVLYTISLAVAIFSNFYIAYMLCIFVCIYFVYEVLRLYQIRKDFKTIKSIVIKFILSSLLAGGIASILLIPAILNLSEIMRFSNDTALSNVSTSNYFELIFSRFFSKLYLGSHISDTVLSRQNPNLYTGIITFVLICFYYFNNKIKTKEKVLTSVVLFIFFLSFLLPSLNLFWHGFSLPNGYVYRFSFLFSFFLILISCKSFMNLQIKIFPIIFMIIIPGILGYILFQKNYAYLSIGKIILTSAFIIIYIVILVLMCRCKKKKQLGLLLLAIVLIELYCNINMTMITNNDFLTRKMYKNFYNETCEVTANLENNFYRIDGDYLFSYLDEMICDTKGFTTSLTTNNGDLYRWLYDYGYPLNFTTVISTPNNPPVLESLFGIKYFYSKDVNNDYYKQISQFKVTRYNHVAKEYYDSNINIYVNHLALSLGYLINNNYDSIYEEYDKTNPFEYQNAFVSALTGTNQKVYTPFKKEKLSYSNFKFTIDGDPKYIYLGFKYKIPINTDYFAELYINGNFVSVLSSDNSGILRVDNNFGKEIEVSLRYISTNQEANDLIENSTVMYNFNEDVLLDAIDTLSKEQMTVEVMDGNYVKGSINVKNDNKVLFTSIPYEKGWRVYVDGKKAETLKINGEFVGVELDNGEHTVEFKFWPRGLTIGIIVSLSSITTLIIYKRYTKKKDKKGTE